MKIWEQEAQPAENRTLEEREKTGYRKGGELEGLCRLKFYHFRAKGAPPDNEAISQGKAREQLPSTNPGPGRGVIHQWENLQRGKETQKGKAKGDLHLERERGPLNKAGETPEVTTKKVSRMFGEGRLGKFGQVA